jgi:hypothetical protein
MQLMGDPEHKDFETHCDCFVYKSEINTERFSFGRVEFVDISKASGCVKQQLNNVYLLYYDTICVAVYNEHPKKNIELIKGFIKEYQTDTTNLAEFVTLDSAIRIKVNRICKDTTDKYHGGEYVNWRTIEYSTVTKPFLKTKDDSIGVWCKWTK